MGATLGPSQRLTVDWSNLDNSTENIVYGQSGNPLSPWYSDQWPYWYGRTTFTLPFSEQASRRRRKTHLAPHPVTTRKPAKVSVSTAEWQRRAIIFLCALVVALSLAWRGNSCGHDFDFHIQSWLAVAQQWQQGTFYPHWIEAANYGAGEPRFVFYPPLSWMLGALLGIVLGWPAAPIAFTLVVITASGVTMNKLAREWLTPNAATVAACAYISTPTPYSSPTKERPTQN